MSEHDVGRPDRKGMARYSAAWVAGGAAVALAIVFGVRGGSEAVTLPPVQQVRLENAARQAHCDLVRRPGPRPLNPPVEGQRRDPAVLPGIHERPADARRLLASMRAGRVVLQYRNGDDEDLAELEELQRELPKGTVLIPNGTRMAYGVAATAWRRLLGCPELSPEAADAIRLFRGRYVGRIPDDP